MPTAAPWRWRWIPAAEHLFSARFACPVCSYALPELEPRLFSFNNPMGACPKCDGLGQISFFDPARVVAYPHLSLASGAIRGWDRRNQFYYQLLASLAAHYGFDIEQPFEALAEAHRQIVLYGSGREKIAFRYLSRKAAASTRDTCLRGHRPQPRTPLQGDRLRRRARGAGEIPQHAALPRMRGHPPAARGAPRPRRRQAICRRSAPAADRRARLLQPAALEGQRAQVAEKIVREITARLTFLINVGLDYLSLDRSADTLSGGEAQRIRLASQIGSGLTGVMYVLDEPSIGLHQRDNARLLATLAELRDLGNTVIVVEHDEEAIHAADHVVDMGPGAGEHGGRIVAEGTPQQITANTGLAHRRLPLRPARHRHPEEAPPPDPTRQLRILGAQRQQPEAGRRCRPAGRACSPASPASPARANPRSSTTRSTPPPRATSTAPAPSRRRSRPSRGWSSSTR
jgi:excinuclease ABC subunit A